MENSYHIRAVWDPDAKVYYSETNVPGLVVETETLSEFASIAEQLLPEMLAANTQEIVSSERHITSGDFRIAV